MEANKITITLKGKTVVLSYNEFAEEIDIDDLFRIDLSNINAEILTFPVVLNKLGIMLAEADNEVAEAKMNLEVYESKCRKKLRETMSKPTIDAVDDGLKQDALYQIKRKKFIQAEFHRNLINSSYWSAKDKSEKLDKISLTLNFSDVDLTEMPKVFNNVNLRRRKLAIE